ncbi:MAG TPA: aminoacyl-tRNA hydrolase [Planctomycetota bacterium]|nr:aminoacyl-tRNA hydrolase [Planctomycetota bacterium]
MVDSRQELEARRRLVVGLGNPGPDYAGTRHNVGFEVLESLAATLGLRLSRQERTRGLGPVKAKVAEYRSDQGGDAVYLVEPWTYMNLSGEAVAAYARFFGIRPDSIFVIYDDLHLPLGRIRIRPGGSPGGHNGIKSLTACLGSEGYPRLRMGIAVTGFDASDMADPDFVLGRFSVEERLLLDKAIPHAVQAVRAWIDDRPLDEIMAHYNALRVEESPSSASGSGNEPSSPAT